MSHVGTPVDCLFNSIHKSVYYILFFLSFSPPTTFSSFFSFLIYSPCLCLGLTFSLLPRGFQPNVFFLIDSIPFHLFVVCNYIFSILFVFTISFWSGLSHLICKLILLRHLFRNVCNFCSLLLLVFHVLHPYSRLM